MNLIFTPKMYFFFFFLAPGALVTAALLLFLLLLFPQKAHNKNTVETLGEK